MHLMIIYTKTVIQAGSRDRILGLADVLLTKKSSHVSHAFICKIETME